MQNVRRVGRVQRRAQTIERRRWIVLVVILVLTSTFIAGVETGTNVTLSAVNAVERR